MSDEVKNKEIKLPEDGLTIKISILTGVWRINITTNGIEVELTDE